MEHYTSEAAGHLSRAQQTLRIWACREDGPIRPIRINGRLAWPVGYAPGQAKPTGGSANHR
ncbi:MAG TPA: hypothetical protein PK043_05395, partial [Alicycliphilus sp.]|nr:hypothetical protein [Alicycliphilus sp.]